MRFKTRYPASRWAPPLSHKSFWRKTFHHYAVKMPVLITGVLLIYFGYANLNSTLTYAGVALIVSIETWAAWNWYSRNANPTARRLRAIYRTSPIRTSPYTGGPLWGIALFALLALKKHGSDSRAPFILRRPIVSSAAAAIVGYLPLALAGANVNIPSRIVYWVSPPSGIFLHQIVSDVRLLIENKPALLAENSGSRTLAPALHRLRPEGYSTTGAILGSAIVVMHHGNRKPASVSPDQEVRISLDMIEDTLAASGPGSFASPLGRFNPVAFFHSSGAIEIALTTAVDFQLVKKYAHTVRSAFKKTFQRIESQLPSISDPEEQRRLRDESEQLKSRVYSSN